MAVLEEIGQALSSAADRVGPAVVGLGRGWGRGSGVVSAPGVVLTNAHNLRGDEVTVTFADGRRETGSVAGVDVEGDLAAVTVDTGDVEPLEWGDPDSLGTGSPVIALSNPGGRGLRATLGFVSATGRSFRGPRGRRIRGTIEHTAPLQRPARRRPGDRSQHPHPAAAPPRARRARRLPPLLLAPAAVRVRADRRRRRACRRAPAPLGLGRPPRRGRRAAPARRLRDRARGSLVVPRM